jgi:hypothetical protein
VWPCSSGIRDLLKKNLERIWSGKDEQRNNNLYFSLQGLILFYFQQVLRVHNIQEANEGKASIATCSSFYHLSLLVISDLASGTARHPPLIAATIIINELFL